MKTAVTCIALCALLAIGSALAEPRDPQYREAMKAMKARNYDEAETLFQEVIDRGDEDVDASLYWRAFSLHKLNRDQEALATLDTLKRSWPDSSWLDDAKALRIEVGAAMGLTPDPDEHGDVELKLIALANILHSDPDRAMDLLEDIVNGDHPEELREQALFVLVQKPTERGKKLLRSIASESSSEDLRRSAVSALTAGQFKGTRDFLMELYRTETNMEFRKIALDGFIVLRDGDAVVQLASEETEPELLETLAQQLGIMKKSDKLREMYEQDHPVDVKEAVLHGLFIAGEKETLHQIALRETDLDLQERVLHSLALAGGCNELKEIYEATDDVNRKVAAIQPVFLNKKCDWVKDVVENETHPEVRRAAIRTLSLNARNKNYLREAYQKAADSDSDTKMAFGEAFFLLKDVDQLILMAREETDRDVRKQAVRYLSLSRSQKAKDFINDLLK